MTNFEYYKNEILSYGIDNIAIVGHMLKKCHSNLCSCCKLSVLCKKENSTEKYNHILMFGLSEHLALTNRQYNLCIALAGGYLVRNNNGNLVWFNFPPEKKEDSKSGYKRHPEDAMDPMYINDHTGYFPTFDFIHIGDEPHSVIELIINHENEENKKEL